MPVMFVMHNSVFRAAAEKLCLQIPCIHWKRLLCVICHPRMSVKSQLLGIRSYQRSE